MFSVHYRIESRFLCDDFAWRSFTVTPNFANWLSFEYTDIIMLNSDTFFQFKRRNSVDSVLKILLR